MIYLAVLWWRLLRFLPVLAQHGHVVSGCFVIVLGVQLYICCVVFVEINDLGLMWELFFYIGKYSYCIITFHLLELSSANAMLSLNHLMVLLSEA